MKTLILAIFIFLIPSVALADGVFKIPEDSTVWLVKDNIRSPFISAASFLNQGYKWSDVQTVSLEQLISYPTYNPACDSLKDYGVAIRDAKGVACDKVLQVFQNYGITKEIMNGVTIQFFTQPFVCNTDAHGSTLRNGCYYYRDQLLQIVIDPNPYNFNYLMLHEIARVNGIRPDDQADQYAFDKIRARRAFFHLPDISNQFIMFSIY